MDHVLLTRYDDNDRIEEFDEVRRWCQDDAKAREVLKAINAYGFTKPSDIQRLAIGPVARGQDCILQAQSGKGKTGAFLIGGALRVDAHSRRAQVVVMEPTRILAEQTYAVACALLAPSGLSIALHIGGSGRDYKSVNTRSYDRGGYHEQVVVATPGRFQDLMEGRDGRRAKLDSTGVSMLVLDEADQLLSSEFQDDIRKIVTHMSYDTQAVLVSATIPYEMVKLAERFLREDHVRVLLPEDEVNLSGIAQYYVNLGGEEYKADTLVDLLGRLSDLQTFVFVNSKHTLEHLRGVLRDAGITAEFLHGEMPATEREAVMYRFRTACKVLVSTDLTSRGIDVHQAALVINYDVPRYHTTYIHRVGRTGRYGKKGTAITFLTEDARGLYDEICTRYFIDTDELPESLVQTQKTEA